MAALLNDFGVFLASVKAASVNATLLGSGRLSKIAHLSMSYSHCKGLQAKLVRAGLPSLAESRRRDSLYCSNQVYCRNQDTN
jgi:hypothetical protein